MASDDLPSDPLASDAERELDQIETSLADIERAIAGLDDGTYGKCAICGDEIGADRLADRATESRCATHAEV